MDIGYYIIITVKMLLLGGSPLDLLHLRGKDSISVSQSSPALSNMIGEY